MYSLTFIISISSELRGKRPNVAGGLEGVASETGWTAADDC